MQACKKHATDILESELGQTQHTITVTSEVIILQTTIKSAGWEVIPEKTAEV